MVYIKTEVTILIERNGALPTVLFDGEDLFEARPSDIKSVSVSVFSNGDGSLSKEDLRFHILSGLRYSQKHAFDWLGDRIIGSEINKIKYEGNNPEKNIMVVFPGSKLICDHYAFSLLNDFIVAKCQNGEWHILIAYNIADVVELASIYC